MANLAPAAAGSGGGSRPRPAPETAPRECTLRAIILGTVLGMVFGASSLYLVLKVGLTVSASIPVAVISLALFRLWSKAGGRDATILENNIVQTAGSAGESIAFGLGVTMPAILILGFDLEISRVMLVGLLGSLLGILMMIPLRRALIVAQHGQLKYPEGTACAQVLKAGAASPPVFAGKTPPQPASPAGGAIKATTIFTGFGIGLVYKTLMAAFKLWKDVPEKIFGAPLKGGSLAAEISPELLGVGYIIGPRIASIMMAGGVLSCLVLTPLIMFFGEGRETVLPPGTQPVGQMTPAQIRSAYLLYIGAGAVAAGGIISLLRSLPIILSSLRSGLADFKAAAAAHTATLRADRDLSMKTVSVGIAALILAILAAPSLHMNFLGAALIVIFGFLFVTVSSRLTGEIGSSSNPISGMTVATLLLTCLVFLLVGWTGGTYYVTALSVGGIVCVAASNAGATSQDLKTGYLVGATPKYQQIAILIGAASSALLLGPILLGLNRTATVYVPAAQIAPGLRAPADARLGAAETLRGPQAQADANAYRTWHKTDPFGAPPGKYLVDASGLAVWLVDPGINGAFKTRADGTEVRKFDAPKATLMSYIIKGMLDRKLPWGLVLFGVMIAFVLELCGVSSLAFAVGAYLPISSSAPIFVGGLVRWLLDRRLRRSARARQLDEARLAAESDQSPGVLLASGYIAGGAIAGIVIAFVAGVLGRLDARITKWAEASNPFFGGPHADWLALIPFAALAGFLYLTGRRARRLPLPHPPGGPG
ncbi:MAG TPA: oligopeptide transporter, OPT family [Candidatus Paceibacterota bacterium]|nr:oligopeptide transporter, OPT family [Verrucomicrobiota bacterium]HRY59301.1 oligopeptide transporter, OPT family [Candidatus Paceibacterota bacterium]HOS74479.1 oligopeptide transporter, OPT family [Verrucomicrobiota bacterium]HOW78879.1 oligopeptide transporter, OPT family [Verrucomicrobiota bacterium]HQE90170.1 oligopeptide transporter, OPT family [Verrucomicrobiota bacterium]